MTISKSSVCSRLIFVWPCTVSKAMPQHRKNCTIFATGDVCCVSNRRWTAVWCCGSGVWASHIVILLAKSSVMKPLNGRKLDRFWFGMRPRMYIELNVSNSFFAESLLSDDNRCIGVDALDDWRNRWWWKRRMINFFSTSLKWFIIGEFPLKWFREVLKKFIIGISLWMMSAWCEMLRGSGLFRSMDIVDVGRCWYDVRGRFASSCEIGGDSGYVGTIWSLLNSFEWRCFGVKSKKLGYSGWCGGLIWSTVTLVEFRLLKMRFVWSAVVSPRVSVLISGTLRSVFGTAECDSIIRSSRWRTFVAVSLRSAFNCNKPLIICSASTEIFELLMGETRKKRTILIR